MSSHQPTARDRALRYYQGLAPGPAEPGQATEAYKDIDDLAYALSRVPAFTSRPLKIIAVGAGFSGLSLARAVRSGKLPNVQITIYEKNAGVGGTWYENRYPGYVQHSENSHCIRTDSRTDVLATSPHRTIRSVKWTFKPSRSLLTCCIVLLGTQSFLEILLCQGCRHPELHRIRCHSACPPSIRENRAQSN